LKEAQTADTCSARAWVRRGSRGAFRMSHGICFRAGYHVIGGDDQLVDDRNARTELRRDEKIGADACVDPDIEG
jgi:hypothetical protein